MPAPRLLALPAGLVLSATLALAPAVADAQSREELAARVQRLERTLNSNSLINMLDTVQRLRQEVRTLRGKLEVQENEIRKLRSRQQQAYDDLNGRIEGLAAAAPVGDPLAGDGEDGSVVTLLPPQPGEGDADEATPGVVVPEDSAAEQPPAAPAPPTRVRVSPSVAARAPGSDLAAEQVAYRAAFDLLKSRKYQAASEAFAGFLSDYPNGRFADNAMYWLGESFYVSRRFDPALKAFESLIADYPDSSKRGHALLKIGFIYDEIGQDNKARDVLRALIAAEPSSTAAGLAAKRLERLN